MGQGKTAPGGELVSLVMGVEENQGAALAASDGYAADLLILHGEIVHAYAKGCKMAFDIYRLPRVVKVVCLRPLLRELVTFLPGKSRLRIRRLESGMSSEFVFRGRAERVADQAGGQVENIPCRSASAPPLRT